MKKLVMVGAVSVIVGGLFGGVVGKELAPKDKYLDGNAGAINWTLNSGESLALQYQAYNTATEQLKEAVQNNKSDKKLAVVLDIDETVLSNYGSVIDDYISGNGYSKERFTSWVNEERATAIGGVEDFLNTAKELGVEVFYISNRYPEDMTGTINNMTKLGLPNADEDHILLKSDSSNKAERVAQVEANYDVVMFVGDNLNDFPIGADKKSNDERQSIVTDNEDSFGTKYIVIPNAAYGDFDNTTFGYDFSKTDTQKIQDRDNAIKNN